MLWMLWMLDGGWGMLDAVDVGWGCWMLDAVDAVDAGDGMLWMGDGGCWMGMDAVDVGCWMGDGGCTDILTWGKDLLST